LDGEAWENHLERSAKEDRRMERVLSEATTGFQPFAFERIIAFIGRFQHRIDEALEFPI
jgi:hypothetical protein